MLPTFRPDAVVDAEYSGFQENLKKLGEVSGEDVSTLERLFECAAIAAGVLQEEWRDGDGPWTPDGADGGPLAARGGAAV